MKHKWHKEIKAWADGAEIEMRWSDGEIHTISWSNCSADDINWNQKLTEYRIKPQPSVPQYLYVYESNSADGVVDIGIDKTPKYAKDWVTIARIKLEALDD